MEIQGGPMKHITDCSMLKYDIPSDILENNNIK